MDMQNANEIIELMKELIENDSVGNRVLLLRMYGAYSQACEDIKQINEYKKRAGINSIHFYVRDVKLIDETSAIIEYQDKRDKEKQINYLPITKEKCGRFSYNTYDEALLGLLCLKTHNENEQAFKYISKILDMDKTNNDISPDMDMDRD